MFSLIYKKSALKGLAKMPVKSRQKMQEALKKIAACPDNAAGDWKPLSGSPYWRLRIGRYRAICDLQDGKLLLLVVKIGPRGDIYK